MRAQTLVRVAARALTGYTYVTLGYSSFKTPGRRVEAAAPLLAKARTVVSIPAEDEALVKANGLTQAGAGALLAAGILPRWAALAIFGTLVPTTLAGHDYWNVDDPAQRGAQQVQFRKNMALLGGLLFCALDSGGRRRRE
jgi:uncharacterized membrane protein YphA (DoxX/SURF4 family)